MFMTASSIVALSYLASVFLAQTPASSTQETKTDLHFDVASVKSSPSQGNLSIQIRGSEFFATHVSVVDLMSYAYGVHSRQIVGGPAWLSSERYDIMARPNISGRPSSSQVKVMVKKLLENRFNLRLHRERKELSVFAIRVSKRGPKIQSNPDPSGQAGVGFEGAGRMIVKNASMTDFAGFLQRFVSDRPAVDETGLAGKYDLRLNWHPSDLDGANAGNQPSSADTKNDDLPDIHTALQEQLGLRLEAAKASVEVVVIDTLSKPTANWTQRSFGGFSVVLRTITPNLQSKPAASCSANVESMSAITKLRVMGPFVGVFASTIPARNEGNCFVNAICDINCYHNAL